MSQPNIVVVLADDLGYSDLGCYGSEIDTPNLDKLAAGGTRLTQFYNTARCSPSRASLLTGLHPHQTGIGVLTGDDTPIGYKGDLNRNCATMAEVFSAAGYSTGMVGKWHLAADIEKANDTWPTRRGFDYFYGTLTGCGSYYSPGTLLRGEQNIDDETLDPSYYYTDAISAEAAEYVERAAKEDNPFFLYVAYTAPHWPLHAPEESVKKYEGHFDSGWDELRKERFKRQQQLGIVEGNSQLSPRDPDEKAWEDTSNTEWQARRMEVYAAMVDKMDQGIGQILNTLEETGQLENTIFIFLSDNGASPEELPHMNRDTFLQRSDIFRPETRDGRPVKLGNETDIIPGPEDSYASYGRPWANLSNTPFRFYKKWTHEGGIAAPFIIHWPAGGLDRGAIMRTPRQLVHVLPTLLEATGVEYPTEIGGNTIAPLEGESFLSRLGHGTERPEVTDEDSESGALYWEHCGNGAIRVGNWKLVRTFPKPWELYDLAEDPTELNDIIHNNSELGQSLLVQWHRWADRVGVLPFERIIDLYQIRGQDAAAAAG